MDFSRFFDFEEMPIVDNWTQLGVLTFAGIMIGVLLFFYNGSRSGRYEKIEYVVNIAGIIAFFICIFPLGEFLITVGYLILFAGVIIATILYFIGKIIEWFNEKF